MKKLLLLLSLSSAISLAGPFDNFTRIEHINSDSTYSFYDWIPPLASNGMLVWDSSTTTDGGNGSFTSATFGDNLEFFSGEVDLSDGFFSWLSGEYMPREEAETAIGDMEADIATKADASSLSGYATTSALSSGLSGKLDSGSFTWSGLSGKPSFATVATSGSYADLSSKPTIPTVDNTSVLAAIGFTPVSQSGARSAISLTTTGSGAATYNSSTGVLNVPTPTTATTTITSGVSRSLSNAAGSTNRFTVSSTLKARLSYSLTFNYTVTALLGASSTLYLEYSTDSGTTWILANQVGKSFSLGLALAGSDDMNVSGEVPANALVRLRPVITGGGATPVYVTGQEVTY